MWEKRITDYKEALLYREALQGGGIVLGLDSMRRLMERMGNPQEAVRFVHIAGTNGKGSVGAFLSSILKRAGYRVGRYSSPAVFTELEKWQIGGRAISKADYARGLEAVRVCAEALEAEGYPYPTPFEAETALAFWYFREKQCDIALLETGMGGLTDATNIIKTAAVSVITQIGMDHMGMLGGTIQKIAEQKAGIVKEGCPVVTVCQKPEAMEVIRNAAAAKNAPLSVADVSEAKKVRYGMEKQSFTYHAYEKLEIGLSGAYQIENAVLAVRAAEALSGCGYPVGERALRRGLAEAKWRGRFSVVSRNPLFVIDGAHNEDAAQKLKESVTIYFTNKRIITIIGILKDKEYDKIVSLMAPLAEQVITVTTPNNRRAFPAYELAGVVREYNPNVTAADSLQEAVEMSYLLAGKDGVILAFGSLSYLGELTKIAENRKQIRRDTHGRSKEN